MLEAQGLNNQQLNHVYVGDRFRCSSSEVANGVFDHIGRYIDGQQQGLLSFEINHYLD